MAASMENQLFCLILLLSLNLSSVNAEGWDADDYELFDLVEEVRVNFYELLGLTQSADGTEIRRAYRKLSLQLHPDKNDDDDAEVKFRNLVSVYEVLKDETRREKYNDVLVNGLPNWRQPAFYYRRVRKFGLLEMSVVLALILTVGHFIVIWSIYFEQRYVKQELYREKRERLERKSRRNKGAAETEIDELLEEELQQIPKPQFRGTLPVLVVKFLFRAITSVPLALRSLKCTLVDCSASLIKSRSEVVDSDVDDRETVAKHKAKKTYQALVLPSAYELADSTEETGDMHYENNSSDPASNVNFDSDHDWTTAEMAALLKAVVKYPGGTSNRWEKIAAVVGRSVRDVTAEAQKIKSQCARHVEPSVQGITAAKLPALPAIQSELSVRDYGETTSPSINKEENMYDSGEMDDSKMKKKRKKKVEKTAERRLLITAGVNGVAETAAAQLTTAAVQQLWSQTQQRQLEAAMVSYPKTVEDRWDRIAEAVEGKTKSECIERYKSLVQYVKSKQGCKSAGKDT